MAQSCRKQIDEEPVTTSNFLRISTSAVNNGDVAENAIRTLRLFIFDKEGNLVINKLFQTKDAQSGSISAQYTYFVKDDAGNYQISELIKKGDIYVMMVANEISPLNKTTYTMDEIRGELLNFRDMYHGTEAYTDIVITGVDNGVDNKGFIPMFAESGLVTQGNWDVALGKVINLRLVRNLAKLSIKIKGSSISDPTFENGDELIIKSISVGRMPIYSFLGYVGTDVLAPFTFSSTVNFKTPITIKGGINNPVETDKLTLYITEYLITQQSIDNLLYAFLQINAVLNKADGSEIFTNYRIPIGNGMSKLYGMNVVRPQDLSISDLTVTRNNHYNLEATIKTVGALEALQVDAIVKGWESTVDVNGDDSAPLLNVSSIVTKMTESKGRVHFWTNQPDIHIEATGSTDGGSFVVNDLFKNLSSNPGSSTTNFVINAAGTGQYFRYNGYIDFEFVNPNTYIETPKLYTVVLKSGKLSRSITVESNPVVGQIVFDANGGSFPGNVRTFTKELRLSDIGLDTPLVSSIVTIGDPRANLTPPPGKILAWWVYSLNGPSAANPVGEGKLEVTMSEYVIKLYALWR